MNRSTMRDLVRRRIGDTQATDWEDADINDMLNVACGRVEAEVRKVNPGALKVRATINLIAGRELYEKPSGYLYEFRVGYKDSAQASGYRKMTMRPYEDAVNIDTSSDAVYSHWGNYFAILPIPATTIAAGLQVDYASTVTMGADDAVPPLPIPLHMAIVCWAELLLRGETSESLDPTAKLLNSLLGDLHLWYHSSAAGNEQIRFDGVAQGDYGGSRFGGGSGQDWR